MKASTGAQAIHTVGLENAGIFAKCSLAETPSSRLKPVLRVQTMGSGIGSTSQDRAINSADRANGGRPGDVIIPEC